MFTLYCMRQIRSDGAFGHARSAMSDQSFPRNVRPNFSGTLIIRASNEKLRTSRCMASELYCMWDSSSSLLVVFAWLHSQLLDCVRTIYHDFSQVTCLIVPPVYHFSLTCSVKSHIDSNDGSDVMTTDLCWYDCWCLRLWYMIPTFHQ